MPALSISHERVVFAVVFILVVGAEALLGAQIVSALSAAGVDGGTPVAGFANFVKALKGNLVWVAVTVVSIAVIGIGLLFLFGHSRAQDYAIKALAGAAIIASGTGIVA